MNQHNLATSATRRDSQLRGSALAFPVSLLAAAAFAVAGCSDADARAGESVALTEAMALAADAAPTEGPFPLLDANLTPLLGRWSCEGEQFASPIGPGVPNLRVTMAYQRILEGYWYTIDALLEDAANDATVFAWHSVLGFDPTTSRLTRRDYERFAGVSDGTSNGFADDTLVWQSYDGKAFYFRETVVLTDAGLTLDVEIRASEVEAFAPLVSVTCVRD